MLVIYQFKARAVRLLVFAASVGVIVSLGTPVFSPNKAGTAYKKMIDADFTEYEVKKLSNIFHREGKERPVVLYRNWFSTYRLYDPTVISVMTRATLLEAASLEWSEFRHSKAMTKSVRRIARVYLYRDYDFPVKKFYQNLKKNNVDYIVSDSAELDTYLSQSKRFAFLDGIGNQRVWKVVTPQKEA